MIRLVTLDVNNTLLKFRCSPGEEYCRVAAAYGITADPAALNTALKKALAEQNQVSPVFGSGGEGWQSWWNKVVKLTFERANIAVSPPAHQAISHHLLQWYFSGLSYTLLPYAHEFLELLAAKNVTLGIITNTDPRIKKVLADHGISSHFKFMLDAYSVGFLKPNKKIFEIALKEAGLPNLQASEALHIGDSVRKDFIGAREAGWESFLVAADGQKQCTEEEISISQDRMFISLDQLMPVLEKI